jgi:hypothetical protein
MSDYRASATTKTQEGHVYVKVVHLSILSFLTESLFLFSPNISFADIIAC